jgi:mono/diheme cytochrome c family protein
MKRVKKILAVVAALAAVLVLGLVSNFYFLLPKSRPATAVTAPTTAEAIERGKYLSQNVSHCFTCHSPANGAEPGDPYEADKLGWGRDYGELPDLGHVTTPNLTSDKETGLGNWTDGEILRAMREGISKDGHVLFPMMPYNMLGESMSDDDSLAIIAYLRTLPAHKNDPGRSQIKFPISMIMRQYPRPLEKAAPSAPPPSDTLARGQWLLRVGNCAACHTPLSPVLKAPIPGQYLAGGMKFDIEGGGVVYALNITSDRTTGIGNYSDEDLMRVFNEGIGKSGQKLFAMPWTAYRNMTEGDKRAIVAALRAVPAVQNVVPAAVRRK